MQRIHAISQMDTTTQTFAVRIGVEIAVTFLWSEKVNDEDH